MAGRETRQGKALHTLHVTARKLASSHASEAKETAAPAAIPIAPDSSTRNFAAAKHQADEGVFKVLSPNVLVELRQNHVKVAGDDPLRAATSMAELLAALHSKVSASCSPYVDFISSVPTGTESQGPLNSRVECSPGHSSPKICTSDP